jgi:hypothetical protein
MQETSLAAVNIADIELLSYLTEGIKYIALNFPGIFSFIKTLISIYVTLSIPISLLFFILIVIYVEKLKSIRKKEDVIYNAKVDMGYREEAVDVKEVAKKEVEKNKANEEMSRRWANVLTYVESTNANDWRHAVIEADIILGDMLTGLGYRGEGIGEQLKRVVRGDFKTLDEAWEAHKIRNELAHAGSDYPFSQFEARRVVNLYRKVFEEFFHI